MTSPAVEFVCCRECGRLIVDGACPDKHSQQEPAPPPSESFWTVAAKRILAPETEAAASELLSVVCPGAEDVNACFVSEEAREVARHRFLSPAGRAAQKKLVRALMGREEVE